MKPNRTAASVATPGDRTPITCRASTSPDTQSVSYWEDQGYNWFGGS
jgi:hypothetical protein